ncbi:BLUF domain-containing protein [Aurantimonas sp. VKM B-3413]|uniref:BLUF domain-containing protein n=1 Tax=Aurantimonas sp. VKM B-3413 TaxID=2779401 RepID=UPI001E65D9C6|nr:BLUF domain-containing protein [Aurantimonas sp. VKM B-3413]MCB8836754.1 BLUF domain-containing protein [Aurantimonas sp. VKM B-3413]
MSVYRLAYVSRPAPLLTAVDIADIMKVAERRNAELGITGLLVHDFGRFVQLLEGPLESIETLMRAIILDRRHSDIRIFLQQTAERRSLDRWVVWSDYAASRLSDAELHLHEDIVQAALESLADLDRDRRPPSPGN